MSSAPIPLIILGGRDRHGSKRSAQKGLNPLTGYKALDLELGGRRLIEHVVERWQGSGAFAPIYIAGPAERYRPLDLGTELVDTDEGFGGNLMAGLNAVIAQHGRTVTAVTTSDVLPDQGELAALIADYRDREPCDFWMPQIRSPQDPERLGASDWKPRYRIAPEDGAEPVEILPGHLVLADVSGVRLDLMQRMFDLAYRTRNRPVAQRKAMIARRLLGWLIRRDLASLLRGELPTLTWQSVRYGTAMARELGGGTISAPRLASLIRHIYCRRAHARAHPERRGYMPIVDGMSLAKDIDTQGEAREMELELAVDP